MRSKQVSKGFKLLALLCIFSMVLLVPIKPTLADVTYRSSAEIWGDDNNPYVVVELYGKATTNSITITDITYWVCFYNRGGSNDNLNDFKLFLNGNQIGDTLNVKHGCTGSPGSWLRDNGWSLASPQDGDPYREWYTKTVSINQTITGLNPSTAYVINSVSGSIDAYDNTIHKRKPVMLNSLYPTVTKDSYTVPVAPSISFTNIKDTSLKVVWSQNGNNAYATFSLYRRLVGTSTWTALFYNVADTYEFTDTGLNKESSYEYHLNVVNYHSGADGTKPIAFDVYSTVSTTEDPAVAAAQEAASAARAAKQSAELSKQAADIAATNSLSAYGMAQQARDNTWDADENKSAAQLAKEARDKANQALTSSRVPVIRKLEGLNGATCTITDFFVVTASTDYDDATFEVTCEGPCSPTITVVDDRITLSDLNVPGAYTVKVTASLGQAKSTSRLTLFRLFV